MLARAFLDFFTQQEDAFLSGFSLEIALEPDDGEEYGEEGEDIQPE